MNNPTRVHDLGFTGQIRPLYGKSRTAQYRARYWSTAREVRAFLKPIRPQAEVAKLLKMTRQGIEQVELRALAKIIRAFGLERHEQD